MSFNGYWVKQTDPTDSLQWRALASNEDGSHMVATVNNGDIYRSSDYGNTWIPTGDPALNPSYWGGVASNALGNHMIAVADSKNIYYSSDFGASWTAQANPLLIGLAWRSCASNAVGDLMIATISGGDVYKSIDFGVTWTNITTINGAPSTAFSCALSSSGQYIFINSYSLNLVYISADFGATWNESTTQPTGTDPCNVKCNGSGQYAIVGSASGMWWSHDYGVNWTLSNTIFPDPSYFFTVASNLVGDEMYSSLPGSGIYKSIDYGETWTISTDPEINTLFFVSFVTFSHSDVLGALGGLAGAASGFIWNYYNGTPPPPPPPVICFKEGSTLLSLVNGKEQYIPIQDIRTGTLIKTSLNGYVPVHTIGTSKLYNSGDKLRGKNRLYRLTQDKYPELTEDLIITGCHSILVGELSEKQHANIIDELGRIMVTNNKYRLMAVYDDRADPYEEDGIFDIWHLALDHVDPRMNYGVYANGGLLVETTSQRMLKEFSGMTLV